MDTSAKFADALRSRLHRLETGGDPGGAAVIDWPVDGVVEAGAAAAAAIVLATDSWDSALSNSPEDAAWWSGGGGQGDCTSFFRLPTDEGFLDEETGDFKAGEVFGDLVDNDNVDGDDTGSVSSDGSEILQMVNELLLAFNIEVAEAAAAAATAATEYGGVSEAAIVTTASSLTTGFYLEAEGKEVEAGAEVEAPSDHQFGEERSADGKDDGEFCLHNCWAVGETDGGEDADNEASSTASSAYLYSASASVESLSDQEQQILPPPPPPPLPQAPFLATGLFRMPQEAVLEAMDFWGPLDRIRWLLWRADPCPPRQLQSQTSPSQQALQQPQQQHLQPRDKSKRACSFLLKGRCRKEDCEFAHDLSQVTCKFWAAGQCFKGSACPFLHGYAP